MKTRNIIVAIAVTTGLFVTGAVAQHEEHHQDNVPPPATTNSSKPGGMPSGNVMPNMSPMMTSQRETGKLVDQLMKGFAGIEAEKNPTALREKLTEHGALLKELQAKVQDQSHMMDMMVIP